jgi:predicted metal-dependent HD superfamily phosphohydrolase
MVDTEALLERWIALAGVGAAGYGRELIERYQHPSRRYHTAEHLMQVLDVVDELAEGTADVDVRAVRYAAWFHDAVYSYEVDADSQLTNEERSAQLAESVLRTLGEPDDRVREVSRLIRLTERHAPQPDDRNGAVLCDADLAILGSDQAAYARYRVQIRAEYQQIPELVFRSGRAKILRELLALPRLFHTDAARSRYEAAARANVAAEIAALES